MANDLNWVHVLHVRVLLIPSATTFCYELVTRQAHCVHSRNATPVYQWKLSTARRVSEDVGRYAASNCTASDGRCPTVDIERWLLRPPINGSNSPINTMRDASVSREQRAPHARTAHRRVKHLPHDCARSYPTSPRGPEEEGGHTTCVLTNLHLIPNSNNTRVNILFLEFAS